MGIFKRWGSSRLRLGALVALLGTALVSLELGLFRPPVASGAHFSFVQHEDFRPVPVVMVVFDELPAASLMTRKGRIDEELFPNFARLARGSMWFRNTTTTGVFTKDAMPSILTGKYPDPQLGVTDPHPHNLFTLLGDAYPIEMIARLPGFCPVVRCTPGPGAADLDLGPRFGAFDHSERGADLTRVLGMIEEVNRKEPGRPAFYFAHAVLPHSPWRYLPSGQRYDESEPEPGEIDIPGPGKAWADDPWLVTQVQQRHLLQLALVDRLVGRLVRTMKRAGIYDDSLLVVTADHGIAFEPGLPKRLIRDPVALGAVARVPLFIKPPHVQRGRTFDRPVSVVDVLPTIADILDLSKVWSDLDGSSVLKPRPNDRDRTIEGFRLDPSGLEVYRAIRTKYRRFGRADGSLDLFGIGPGSTERLVGLNIADLDPALLSHATATITNAETHGSADPDGPAFPALVEGTVTGAVGGRLVAIVVNDHVIAMTRTYHRDGETSFYAMVSPTDFGEPPNEIHAVVLSHP